MCGCVTLGFVADTPRLGHQQVSGQGGTDRRVDLFTPSVSAQWSPASRTAHYSVCYAVHALSLQTCLLNSMLEYNYVINIVLYYVDAI